MTKTLVERLCDFPGGVGAEALCREAAAEIERLQSELALQKEATQFAIHNLSEQIEQERKQPIYRKWPGEPPHCMSCDCGMTDEQKRTVPEADYLRIHKELMDLKYPGSSPVEPSAGPPPGQWQPESIQPFPGKYLVTGPYGTMMGEYDPTRGWVSMDADKYGRWSFAREAVTHWMPVPESPESAP